MPTELVTFVCRTREKKTHHNFRFSIAIAINNRNESEKENRTQFTLSKNRNSKGLILFLFLFQTQCDYFVTRPEKDRVFITKSQPSKFCVCVFIRQKSYSVISRLWSSSTTKWTSYIIKFKKKSWKHNKKDSLNFVFVYLVHHIFFCSSTRSLCYVNLYDKKKKKHTDNKNNNNNTTNHLLRIYCVRYKLCCHQGVEIAL